MVDEKNEKLNDDEKLFMQKLGQRIKIIRSSKEIKQATLAKTVSCSTSYLSNVEQGKRLISLIMLRRIAKAFDLTLTGLLGDWNKIYVEKVDLDF